MGPTGPIKNKHYLIKEPTVTCIIGITLNSYSEAALMEHHMLVAIVSWLVFWGFFPSFLLVLCLNAQTLYQSWQQLIS